MRSVGAGEPKPADDQTVLEPHDGGALLARGMPGLGTASVLGRWAHTGRLEWWLGVMGLCAAGTH